MIKLPVRREAVVLIMFEIVSGLPDREQLALKRYWIDNFPAKDAAHAAGMSLESFRTLKRHTRERFLEAVARPDSDAITKTTPQPKTIAATAEGWLQ